MAFPSEATIYDAANRANGNISAGAGSTLWENLGIHDNSATGITVTLENIMFNGDNSVRSAINAGPILQYWTEITTSVEGSFLFMPILVTNAGPEWNGYGVIYIGGGNWQIRKYTNGSSETLKEIEVENKLEIGDGFGIERQSGGKLIAWKRHSAVWSEVINVTDATYSLAGKFGLWGGDATIAIDNVSIGPLGSPTHSFALPSRMSRYTIVRM